MVLSETSGLQLSGPFLHVHHREDEWYYVLSSEFLFRAGREEFNLSTGSSIWSPRGIPHVWANTGTIEGRLILMCQPAGFEKFFDEIGNVPISKKSPATMKELMAKYGMEMLGPRKRHELHDENVTRRSDHLLIPEARI